MPPAVLCLLVAGSSSLQASVLSSTHSAPVLQGLTTASLVYVSGIRILLGDWLLIDLINLSAIEASQ